MAELAAAKRTQDPQGITTGDRATIAATAAAALSTAVRAANPDAAPHLQSSNANGDPRSPMASSRPSATYTSKATSETPSDEVASTAGTVFDLRKLEVELLDMGFPVLSVKVRVNQPKFGL